MGYFKENIMEHMKMHYKLILWRNFDILKPPDISFHFKTQANRQSHSLKAY